MTTKTKTTPKAKATTAKALPSMEQLQTRADTIAKGKTKTARVSAMTAAVNIKAALDKATAPKAADILNSREAIIDRVAALKLTGARVDYTGTVEGGDARVWWVLIPGAKEHTDNVCLGKTASMVTLASDAKLWATTEAEIVRKFAASAKRTAAAKVAPAPAASKPTLVPAVAKKTKTAKATVEPMAAALVGAAPLVAPKATAKAAKGAKAAPVAKAAAAATQPATAGAAGKCAKCGMTLSGKRTACRNEGACTKRQAVAV